MTTTINGRTPEEIKKGLKFLGTTNVTEKVELASQGLAYAYYEDFAADTLAYIQQLEEQVPKWISTEERLPEDNVSVLAYIASKKENVDSVIAITSYTNNMHGYNISGWYSPWQYCFWDREVTHWMPLPEPPKEVEM